MHRSLAVAVLLGSVSLSACGGNDAPTLAASVPCVINMTGGITATLDCTNPIVAVWTTSNDSTIVFGNAQGVPALAVSIPQKGVPVTGTFKHSDANARGFVSASTSSNGWIATTAGMPGGMAPTGTWTMVLTSVTQNSSDATGKGYTLHGTIDATMTAIGGGNSTTAHITF